MTINKKLWDQIKQAGETINRIRKEVNDIRSELDKYGDIDITEKFDQIVLGVKSDERHVYEELRGHLEEIKEQEYMANRRFLDLLTGLILPIDKDRVKKRGEYWVFPFIAEEKIFMEELRAALGRGTEEETFQLNDAIIYNNRIEIKAVDRKSAMNSIINLIRKIQEEAKALLNIESVAKNLTSKRLEVLEVIAENSPIRYSDISIRVAGEKGAVRGFFYRLLEPPQLIQKDEKGNYILTKLGQRVLEYRRRNRLGEQTQGEGEFE